MARPSTKSSAVKDRKVALMGSRSVGKTSLITQFIESKYVDRYYPTIEASFRKNLVVKGQTFSLEVHDTAGQDEHSSIGARQAAGLHGWVLVYSIAWRASFEMLPAVRDKILDSLGVDSVPMVLVGNKLDLAASARAVSAEEGAALAKSWGCGFVETSAATNANVTAVFELLVTAVEAAMDPPPEQPGDGCVIV